MVAVNLLIYLFSFVSIWLGAGLIVSSVDKFSRKLKMSSFAVSFFVLGMLTSIPEFAVGLTSLSEHNPNIFVGNLIGGVATIFMLIIPLLAIFGNGIKLNHQLTSENMILAFVTMLTPAFMVMDKRVTNLEGVIMIVMYAGLFYFIESKKGVMDGNETNVLRARYYSIESLLRVLLGIAIVFVSSNAIVNKTLFFAKEFNISPFYLSLIVLAVGTNLPELSIAVRSVISGRKDVAFGDYMGSAAANTFLFGLFTLLNSGEVVTGSNFVLTFALIAFGLVLFFYFSRSKNDISREEGFILLCLYIIFVIVELVR
jgi:cation:H+ antiporter